MTTTKVFKAGDRVRYHATDGFTDENNGDLGTVTGPNYDHDAKAVNMTWDEPHTGSHTSWAYVHNLRLAEADPTTFGYNYGKPYATTHSTLFDALTATADRLRDEAQAASKKAWELDALLRDVRIATTEHTYEEANDKLRAYAKANDATLGGTSAGDFKTLAAIPATPTRVLLLGDYVRHTAPYDQDGRGVGRITSKNGTFSLFGAFDISWSNGDKTNTCSPDCLEPAGDFRVGDRVRYIGNTSRKGNLATVRAPQSGEYVEATETALAWDDGVNGGANTENLEFYIP